MWKPLLYEVAAGSLDSYAERLEYLAQGYWHHFRFRLGRMEQLDRAKQEIGVSPTFDENGEEIIPRRRFRYDTLIIAVGSVANDFGVPGVSEHCIMLDTPGEAREFHRRHINACLRAHTQTSEVKPGQLTVGIVGAGATGVELAAELHDTTRELSTYGLENIDPDKSLKLLIVEASDRILPGLPPRLSGAAAERLAELGIEAHVNERVVEVRKDGMLTASGKFIPASMMVWSAGIKAPDFLHEDRRSGNQPREPAGGQTHAADHARREHFRAGRLRGLPDAGWAKRAAARAGCAPAGFPHGQVDLPPFSRQAAAGLRLSRLRIAGCAGRFSTVGNLMGGLSGGSIMIEGAMARLVYWSLHKMHQIALHGWVKTSMTTYAHFISTPTRARIKLH